MENIWCDKKSVIHKTKFTVNMFIILGYVNNYGIQFWHGAVYLFRDVPFLFSNITSVTTALTDGSAFNRFISAEEIIVYILQIIEKDSKICLTNHILLSMNYILMREVFFFSGIYK